MDYDRRDEDYSYKNSSNTDDTSSYDNQQPSSYGNNNKSGRNTDDMISYGNQPSSYESKNGRNTVDMDQSQYGNKIGGSNEDTNSYDNPQPSSYGNKSSSNTEDRKPNYQKQQQDLSTGLLDAGRTVVEAAQDYYKGEGGKVDKAKVAGAASEILEAAEKYGKLDENQGFGKYVDQAENYLNQYGSSGNPNNSGANQKPADDKLSGDASSGGGGFGDAMKFAQSFMK